MIRLIPHPVPVVDWGATQTTAYQPFLDEATGAVGYVVSAEGRPTRLIYLSPSSNDGDDVPAAVFVYLDDYDNPPPYIEAAHHYQIWED